METACGWHTRNPHGAAGQTPAWFASQSHTGSREHALQREILRCVLQPHRLGAKQPPLPSLSSRGTRSFTQEGAESPARWLSSPVRLQPGAAPPALSSALTLKCRAGGCHRRHHMIRYKTRWALLRGYTPQDKFNTREHSRSHWKNSWQGLSNRPLL